MAIAFDAKTVGGYVAATSNTLSHTCTGSDRILFVGFYEDTTTTKITGVTYGGVAMTKIDGIDINNYMSLYYIIAPKTGANNIVASFSSSQGSVIFSSSYTGANQTSQPDASGTDYQTTTNYTKSITTVADNSWLLMIYRTYATTASAGTDTYLRAGFSGGGIIGIYDSNGARTPAGSQALNITNSNSERSGGTIVSFSPASSATINHLLSSTGVGR